MDLDDAIQSRKRFVSGLHDYDRRIARRALLRQYLPAIRVLVDTLDAATVEAELRSLTDRLERGWTHTGNDVDDHWIRLLTRYEVLCDVQRQRLPAHDPGNLITVLTERITLWQS